MNIKTWIAAMAAAACGAVTAAGASPLDISYEEIPLEKIKAEDTLILSDSPEYARNYGRYRVEGERPDLLLSCK